MKRSTSVPSRSSDDSFSMKPKYRKLLRSAYQNFDGKVPPKLQHSVFSSDSERREALRDLRKVGFIEMTSPGHFKIVREAAFMKPDRTGNQATIDEWDHQRYEASAETKRRQRQMEEKRQERYKERELQKMSRRKEKNINKLMRMSVEDLADKLHLDTDALDSSLYADELKWEMLKKRDIV